MSQRPTRSEALCYGSTAPPQVGSTIGIEAGTTAAAGAGAGSAEWMPLAATAPQHLTYHRESPASRVDVPPTACAVTGVRHGFPHATTLRACAASMKPTLPTSACVTPSTTMFPGLSAATPSPPSLPLPRAVSLTGEATPARDLPVEVGGGDRRRAPYALPSCASAPLSSTSQHLAPRVSSIPAATARTHANFQAPTRRVLINTSAPHYASPASSAVLSNNTACEAHADAYASTHMTTFAPTSCTIKRRLSSFPGRDGAAVTPPITHVSTHGCYLQSPHTLNNGEGNKEAVDLARLGTEPQQVQPVCAFHNDPHNLDRTNITDAQPYHQRLSDAHSLAFQHSRSDSYFFARYASAKRESERAHEQAKATTHANTVEHDFDSRQLQLNLETGERDDTKAAHIQQPVNTGNDNERRNVASSNLRTGEKSCNSYYPTPEQTRSKPMASIEDICNVSVRPLPNRNKIEDKPHNKGTQSTIVDTQSRDSHTCQKSLNNAGPSNIATNTTHHQLAHGKQQFNPTSRKLGEMRTNPGHASMHAPLTEKGDASRPLARAGGDRDGTAKMRAIMAQLVEKFDVPAHIPCDDGKPNVGVGAGAGADANASANAGANASSSVDAQATGRQKDSCERNFGKAVATSAGGTRGMGNMGQVSCEKRVAIGGGAMPVSQNLTSTPARGNGKTLAAHPGKEIKEESNGNDDDGHRNVDEDGHENRLEKRRLCDRVGTLEFHMREGNVFALNRALPANDSTPCTIHEQSMCHTPRHLRAKNCMLEQSLHQTAVRRSHLHNTPQSNYRWYRSFYISSKSSRIAPLTVFFLFFLFVFTRHATSVSLD